MLMVLESPGSSRDDQRKPQTRPAAQLAGPAICRGSIPADFPMDFPTKTGLPVRQIKKAPAGISPTSMKKTSVFSHLSG